MDVITIMLIIFITVVSTVTIWLNLPGSFIMAGFTFLWAWISGFGVITLPEVLTILVLVVVLEILEFALSGLATRMTGATKRSAFLAILGGFLGTIILGSMFFVVGALVGLFLGSYLGAYWGEIQAGKSKVGARKAAMGALLGTLAAKVLKSSAVIVLGVWMIKELV